MLDIDHKDGVTSLRLNRPERKNAFDLALTRMLADALERESRDPACRVLVIKGAGDVFSAGRDLRAAGDDLKDDIFAVDDAWVRVFHALHRSPVPSVAVVRGWAVAGGFTLAMGCDFVLAERGAQFGAFEMRHGFPAAVCTPILSRLVGPRLGLEFAMLGEAIPAERLFAAGLINRLAADAAALDGDRGGLRRRARGARPARGQADAGHFPRGGDDAARQRAGYGTAAQSDAGRARPLPGRRRQGRETETAGRILRPLQRLPPRAAFDGISRAFDGRTSRLRRIRRSAPGRPATLASVGAEASSTGASVRSSTLNPFRMIHLPDASFVHPARHNLSREGGNPKEVDGDGPRKFPNPPS